MIWQYIGGAAVTGGVTIIVLLLNRLFVKNDKKADKSDERGKRIAVLEEGIKELKERAEKSERDSCRIQLLLMLKMFPGETAQIMKLAEHYFSVLHGDWYMTGIFNRWLVENNIGQPAWFNPEL